MLLRMRILQATVAGLLVLGSGAAHAQKSAGSQSGGLATDADPSNGQQGKLPPAEVARRDAMLEPGLAKLKAGDNAAAYEAFRPALLAFPRDLRVLRYTAQAAELTARDAEAIDLFTRALAEHPAQPWPLRLGRMQEEAKLARWPAFDADLLALREAKKSDDPALAKSNGFVIDEFQAGATTVQAVIFPTLAGRFHTLYRFLLPAGAPARTSVQASANSPGGAADGKPDPCKNPAFRPYLDVESDDVDQAAFTKAHADKAAKGERSYSLDTYGAPCSQGLVKFYNDGEPTYETVRADIVKSVGAGKAPAKP